MTEPAVVPVLFGVLWFVHKLLDGFVSAFEGDAGARFARGRGPGTPSRAALMFRLYGRSGRPHAGDE